MNINKLSWQGLGLILVILLLSGCSGTSSAQQFDPNKLMVTRTIQGPSDGIASIALNPEGTILAYGNYSDNLIYVVNVASGEMVITLEGHTAAVSSLAFSPNGRLLASTGTVNLPPAEDGTVRIWNIRTGEQLAVFDTSGISQLAFSPDGTLLAGAAGGKPRQIILWDVKTYSQIGLLIGGSRTVSFSPDGKFLASGGGDNFVHVFDVVTGEETMSLSGHEWYVDSTAFSSNGGLLASGGWDATIQVWDVNNGKNLRSCTGHTTTVESLVFSPDGKVLASSGSGMKMTRQGDQYSMSLSSEDQVVRFWRIDICKQIGHIEAEEGVDYFAFSSSWEVAATSESGGLINLWAVK